MTITAEKCDPDRPVITLSADCADDADFINAVFTTFIQGGQLRAYPRRSEPDAIALDPAKKTRKRKAKK